MAGVSALGFWQDGSSTDGVRVKLSMTDNGNLAIKFEDGTERIYAPKKLKTSSRMHNIPLRIELPDGTFVTIEDGELSKQIGRLSGTFIAWIEARILQLALPLLAAAAGILYVIYQYALPPVADYAASRISIEWVNEFGATAFDQYRGEFDMVEGEQRYAQMQADLDRIGRQMLAYAPSEQQPESEGRYDYSFFVSSGKFAGVNAVAFPNGHIIMTAKLYDRLDDNERTAVIAHEIAHVENRDSVRAVARVVSWWFLRTMLFADFTVVAELAILGELKFSRDQEKNADCYAAKMLAASGRSPNAVVTALESIYDHDEDDEPEELADEFYSKIGELLSTHPTYEQRRDHIYACANIAGSS